MLFRSGTYFPQQMYRFESAGKEIEAGEVFFLAWLQVQKPAPSPGCIKRRHLPGGKQGCQTAGRLPPAARRRLLSTVKGLIPQNAGGTENRSRRKRECQQHMIKPYPFVFQESFLDYIDFPSQGRDQNFHKENTRIYAQETTLFTRKDCKAFCRKTDTRRRLRKNKKYLHEIWKNCEK